MLSGMRTQHRRRFEGRARVWTQVGDDFSHLAVKLNVVAQNVTFFSAASQLA